MQLKAAVGWLVGWNFGGLIAISFCLVRFGWRSRSFVSCLLCKTNKMEGGEAAAAAAVATIDHLRERIRYRADGLEWRHCGFTPFIRFHSYQMRFYLLDATLPPTHGSTWNGDVASKQL